MTNFSSSPTSISLPLKKINDEVFMATDEVVRFDSRYVDFIKQSAAKNARGRARICAHRGPSDTLHEMLIAIRSDSYIRPHRHHQKIESFHLVDGSVDVVIFNDDGSIADVVELSIQGNFYYRLDSLGQNLNRFYADPCKKEQPTIWATKLFVTQYAK